MDEAERHGGHFDVVVGIVTCSENPGSDFYPHQGEVEGPWIGETVPGAAEPASQLVLRI